MSQLPWWQRKIVDVERAVAPRLRALTETDEFTTGQLLLARLQGELNRHTEQWSRRALHALNLPAGSDVDRLLRQIASLEQVIRQLSTTLEEQRTANGRDR